MPPRKARQVSTPRSSSASSVTQSLTPDRPQRRYVRMDSPPENVDVWKVLRVPIMLGIFVFIISMLYFKIIPEYHEFLVSTTGLNITTGYFFCFNSNFSNSISHIFSCFFFSNHTTQKFRTSKLCCICWSMIWTCLVYRKNDSPFKSLILNPFTDQNQPSKPCFLSQNRVIAVIGSDGYIVGLFSWIWYLVTWIVKIVVAAIFVGFFLLVLFQRKLLYAPKPPGMQRSPKDNEPAMTQSPSHWQIPFREIFIDGYNGAKLHCWFLHHAPLSNTKVTWLYFHGNAGNIGHRLENYYQLYLECDINILCVEYRSYGDSSNHSITEENMIQDAVRCYKWLLSEDAGIDPERVVIFGRSLGGAVAIATCLRLLEMRKDEPQITKPVGLVVENTFTCVADVAVLLFPVISRLSTSSNLILNTKNRL